MLHAGVELTAGFVSSPFSQAHSYRSYLGFTCLMQVSTRDHDYIIDALELRHHMNILLDPFTNPRIVKVSGWHRS